MHAIRHGVGAAALLLSLTGVKELAAQSAGPAVGTRVRVSVVTRPPGDHLVGTVVALAHDSITLAVAQPESQSDNILTVPLSLVSRMAISRGTRNMATRGLFLGAAAGAVGGTVYGLGTNKSEEVCESHVVVTLRERGRVEECTQTRNYGAIVAAGLIGALVGGGTGFGIGSLIHVERWEKIWIRGMRVALQPHPNGGFSVLVSVGF